MLYSLLPFMGNKPLENQFNFLGGTFMPRPFYRTDIIPAVAPKLQPQIEPWQPSKKWLIPEPKYGRWTEPTPTETIHRAMDVPLQVGTKLASGMTLGADKLLWYAISKVRPDLATKPLHQQVAELSPYERTRIGDFVGGAAEYVGGLRSAGKLLQGLGWQPQAGKAIGQRFARHLPPFMARGAIGEGVKGIEEEKGTIPTLIEAGKGAAAGGAEAAVFTGLEWGAGKVWQTLLKKFPNLRLGWNKWAKGKTPSQQRTARREVEDALHQWRETGDKTAWSEAMRKYAAPVAGEYAAPQPTKIKPVAPEVKQFGKFPLAPKPAEMPFAIKPQLPAPTAPVTAEKGEVVTPVFERGQRIVDFLKKKYPKIAGLVNRIEFVSARELEQKARRPVWGHLDPKAKVIYVDKAIHDAIGEYDEGLAAVVGHEIGHVLEMRRAQRAGRATMGGLEEAADKWGNWFARAWKNYQKAQRAPTQTEPPPVTAERIIPSRQELYERYEKQTAIEDKTENDILGEDYEKWNRAQARLGSRKKDVVREAENIIDQIEAKLSETEKNALYGIGQKAPSAESLRRELDARDDIADALDEGDFERAKRLLRKNQSKPWAGEALARIEVIEKLKPPTAPVTAEQMPARPGTVDYSGIVDMGHRVHDALFTFGEAKRTDPELYNELMKSYARRNAAVEQAVSQLNKSVARGLQISPAEDAALSMIYEDKRLELPPELEQHRNLYEGGAKILQRIEQGTIAKGIIRRPFQERLIEEIQAAMEKYATTLKTPEKSRKLAEMQAEIEELRQMRYLPHTQVAENAIRQKYESLEGEQRRVFLRNLNRISAQFKKRKGKLFLRDYIEAGIIGESEIGFTRLLADTLTDFYYRSAIKDLFDYAKGKELIKGQSDELRKQGWLNQREIGITSPELKGQMVHPVFAEALSEMRDMRRGMKGGRAILGAVKRAQFIKPTIIWVYDTVQKYMRGMYSLNPITEAKALVEATRAVLQENELFHLCNNSNLYQFPYEISRAGKEEQVKLFVRQHSSEVGRLTKLVERATGRSFAPDDITVLRLLTAATDAIAQATWTGDKIHRTQSYLICRKMGYPHDEAIRVAANSHGAYSALSPKYKQIASPLLFVYSFRVLMPLEMAKTLVEPIAGILRTMQGKPPPKHEVQRWAKAWLATAFIPVLIDQYMKWRGYEPEGKHLGPLAWKYRKPITLEDGTQKEMVVGLNYILNMPVKYWNRISYYNPIEPTARPIQAALNLAKWESHPVWRMLFWDIAQNYRSFGEGMPVYNPNAPWQEQLAEISSYVFGQSFRLIDSITRAVGIGELNTEEKRKQKEAMKQGLGLLDRLLFKTFGYSYMRENPRKRRDILYATLKKEFIKRQFHIYRKYEGKELAEQKKELHEWLERCRKWIDQQTVGKFEAAKPTINWKYTPPEKNKPPVNEEMELLLRTQ